MFEIVMGIDDFLIQLVKYCISMSKLKIDKVKGYLGYRLSL